MKHLRNITIIALVALVVAIVPGGGNATSGIFAAITIGFFGAIILIGVRAWSQQSFFLESLAERGRIELYGALGVIALMIAGADELQDTGLGTVVWLILLVGSGWVIFNVFRQADTY